MPITDREPRARLAVVVDGHDLPLGSIDRATRCDLALVDDLARLQLAATRLGWSMRLTCVEPELRELLVLTGLADLLGPEP